MTVEKVPRLGERASGILLHPTSLPGRHGNGDIGIPARRFADFLARCGQSFWQMLPCGPIGYGNSPYSAHSAFAGNALLIDLDELVELDLLPSDGTSAALPQRGQNSDADPPSFPAHVDYDKAIRWRRAELSRAFERFCQRRDFGERLDAFIDNHPSWLPDYALFRAIKEVHDEVEWTRWPAELRDREPASLANARKQLAKQIRYYEFEQWLFDKQWKKFRAYCHDRSIALIGDIPIFVAHDSADVWQHRELFRLDECGEPLVVAGVPPDYFSATGQLWGNPLYRWRVLEKSNYAWWVARLKTTLSRFDIVRLDHFIGFQRYWEVPRAETTAMRGRWVKGPGAKFFETVRREFHSSAPSPACGRGRGDEGSLPLIAEDLGLVTPKVKALRRQFGMPGLRILQFAFGTDPQAPAFLPHNYVRSCVVYTGTHDNDTVRGWYDDRGGNGCRSAEQAEKERKAARAYLQSDGREIHWDMIRMVMMSVAELAIVPLQDVLGLGTAARMNLPGTATGNWEWRFTQSQLTDDIAARLYSLTDTYGRVRANSDGTSAALPQRGQNSTELR